MPHESLEKRVNVPARYRRRKPRYRAKQVTDSGVRDRTISRFNRLKAMGVNPGVSQSQLDTGAGARAVKEALRRARYKKRPATTEPVHSTPRTNSGGGAVAAAYSGSRGDVRLRRQMNRNRRRYRRRQLGDWLYPNDRSST